MNTGDFMEKYLWKLMVLIWILGLGFIGFIIWAIIKGMQHYGVI